MGGRKEADPGSVACLARHCSCFHVTLSRHHVRIGRH